MAPAHQPVPLRRSTAHTMCRMRASSSRAATLPRTRQKSPSTGLARALGGAACGALLLNADGVLLGWAILALLLLQPLHHVPRDLEEGLLNIDVVLGARLKEFDAELVRKRLAPCGVNHLLVEHVALVANQDLVDVVRSMLLDLADPVANVVKRLLICHIVHQQDPHGTAVVRRCDSPEPLLPRRIPDLELEALPLLLDSANLEVDANGCDEGRREGVIREAQQQAALADPAVPDQQQLDQVIVV
mmetsp:Transcript_58999/g.144706  ORF Transcript_58999/g.144706 Transcript_58999/m.144706 type:complete len:245 (-) Transcript_58999:186-920(-)